MKDLSLLKNPWKLGFLTEQERKVIKLYLQGIRLKDIAKKMGVSLSRITQINRRTIDKVTKYYEEKPIYEKMVNDEVYLKEKKYRKNTITFIKCWKLGAMTDEAIAKKSNKPMSRVARIKNRVRKDFEYYKSVYHNDSSLPNHGISSDDINAISI